MSFYKCNSRFCYEEGKLKCARCLAVYYCGRECQKSDWKAHKELCLPPIRVEQRDYNPDMYLFQVNFDKFYSKAGILPVQEAELSRKCFDWDESGNLIINIFAPKLEYVPEPHTVELPADADVASKEKIFIQWETDLDVKTGEMFCTSAMIILMKGRSRSSQTPKTITVRMLARSELPEEFWSNKLNRKDGMKILGGADKMKEIEEMMRKVNGGDKGNDSSKGRSPSKATVAEINADSNAVIEAAVEKVGDVKSKPLVVAIATLESVVSLAKKEPNRQKLVDKGLLKPLVAVIATHRNSARVAVLYCGILNLLSFSSSCRQASIAAVKGAFEGIIAAMETFPTVSTAIAPEPEDRPDYQEIMLFSFAPSTSSDDVKAEEESQNVLLKWAFAAIATLATDVDAPPAPRRSLVDKGAIEIVVLVLQLHIAVPRSDVIFHAVAALNALASGPFIPQDYRKKLGGLGACELICRVIRDNISDTKLMGFAVFAVKSLAMNDQNRAKLGKLGACADVCDALKANRSSTRVAASSLRAMNMLAMNDPDNSTSLFSLGVCKLLVEAFNSHSDSADVADAFCRAVQNLSGAFFLGEKYSSYNLGDDTVCAAVIRALEIHNGDLNVTEQAAVTIYKLASVMPSSRARFLALGAVEIVRSIAASASYSEQIRDCARDAAEVILRPQK